MDYIKILTKRVLDDDLYPYFDNPEHLEHLNDIADNAFSLGTLEGYLAALLIYHQLCEDTLRVLLENLHFTIQIRLDPYEISFPDITNYGFGRLIQELKATINFYQKEQILEKSDKLNNKRNKIIHKLTRNTTLSLISREVGEVKELYAEIFDLFDMIHDGLRHDFYEAAEYWLESHDMDDEDENDHV